MRKMISAFLFAIFVFTVAGNNIPIKAAGLDPYEGFSAAMIDDYKCNRPSFSTSGKLGGLNTGDWACYKELEFGEISPHAVDVYIGSPAEYAGTVELRLDAVDGPVVANIAVIPSSFSTPMKHTVKVNLSFTGKHDLYIMNATKTSDIYEIQFFANTIDKSGYADYDEGNIFSDIKDNPNRNVINTVVSLGLLGKTYDNQFRPNMAVTRGEFAKSIYEILGGNLLGKSTAHIFGDVSPTSDEATAINFLYSIGIINGISATEFKPAKYIQAQDAVIIACKALGYSEMAELKGGYPTGYLSVASEIGLTQGIQTDDILRRVDYAKLIYNAIHAKFLNISTVNGKQEVSYQKVTGILSQTRKIYKASGIVTATFITNLYNTVSGLNYDEVMVNEVVFKVGNTKAAGLLGVYCSFYYTENNEERTLIAIQPNAGVEQLVLSKQNNCDIIQISSNCIKYIDENNRTKDIKLNANTNILYNGKAIDDTLDNMLSGDDFKGSVRCVNNGNGYETIFIDEYESCVIGAIDSAEKTIYDNLSGQSFLLDADDTNLVIKRDGTSLTFRNLAINDIAVVYVSKNQTGKKLYRFYLGDSKVDGTVTQMDETHVWIGDAAYTVSKQFNKTIKVGMTGTFRCNMLGEIVTFDKTDSKKMLIGCYIDVDNTKHGLNSFPKIKFMNAEGKVSIYNCATTIVIDGIVCKSSDQVVNGNGGQWGGLSAVQKKTPIRYMLNDKNEIIRLDTYLTGNEGADDTLKKLTANSLTYRYEPDKQIMAQDGRGIFRVPTTATLISFFGDGSDESFYTLNALGNQISSSTWPIGDIYSSDGEDYIGDIFVWNDRNKSNEWQLPFVFESRNDFVNTEGEEHYKIIGYEGAKKVDYILKKSDLEGSGALSKIFSSLQKGDYLRVKINPRREIMSAEVIFLRDASASRKDLIPTISTDKHATGDSNQYLRLVYGQVVDKKDKFLVVQYGNNPSDQKEILYVSGTSVCKVEKANDEFRIYRGLNLNSIAKNDIVVIYMYYSGVKQIVVYNDAAL